MDTLFLLNYFLIKFFLKKSKIKPTQTPSTKKSKTHKQTTNQKNPNQNQQTHEVLHSNEIQVSEDSSEFHSNLWKWIICFTELFLSNY